MKISNRLIILVLFMALATTGHSAEWSMTDTLDSLCSKISEAGFDECSSWWMEVEAEPWDGEYGDSDFEIRIARFDGLYNGEYNRFLVAQTVATPDFFYRDGDEKGFRKVYDETWLGQDEKAKFINMLNNMTTQYCLYDDIGDETEAVSYVLEGNGNYDEPTLRCNDNASLFTDGALNILDYTPENSEQNNQLSLSRSSSFSFSGSNGSLGVSYTWGTFTTENADFFKIVADKDDVADDQSIRFRLQNTHAYTDLVEGDFWGDLDMRGSMEDSMYSTVDDDYVESTVVWRLDRGESSTVGDVTVSVSSAISLEDAYFKIDDSGDYVQFRYQDWYLALLANMSVSIDFDYWTSGGTDSTTEETYNEDMDRLPSFQIVAGWDSDYCLDVNGNNSTSNGTDIETYKCSGSGERWKWSKSGKIHANWNTNYCIDVSGTNSTSNKKDIQIYKCEEVTETWTLGDDDRIYANWDSDVCMDVSGTNASSNNKDIQIYDCDDVTETWELKADLDSNADELHDVYFKSDAVGAYIRAQGGGNSGVDVKGASGSWPRFDLIALTPEGDDNDDDNCFQTGEYVAIDTETGYYISAYPDGTLDATYQELQPHTWFILTIHDTDNDHCLVSGDEISLKSFWGYYIGTNSSQEGLASSTTIGTFEKFTLEQ